MFSQQERWLLGRRGPYFIISKLIPKAGIIKIPVEIPVDVFTAREMAPGGVLVFSFPCLNSEESPDQLRFNPNSKKANGGIQTLTSLLVSLLFVFTKRDGDTVQRGAYLFNFLVSALSRLQLIGYAVSPSLVFVHAKKYGLRI